jgi:hypothetical protein
MAGRLYADIGWSNSLGWYEGFRLLVAVDPTEGTTSTPTIDTPTYFARKVRRKWRERQGSVKGDLLRRFSRAPVTPSAAA